MLPRITLILAVTASVLPVGCAQQPGGCDYTVESISLGGAILYKHAGDGETVDKGNELWVCKNGQLVRVNNQS